MLDIPAEEVPDFVSSMTDGIFNENWASDLSEWLKSRSIRPLFIHKGESGFGAADSTILGMQAFLGHPVIAMAFPTGLREGHAFVMKIGPTHDEKSAYIVFDPDRPKKKPGSLMIAPNIEIRHYLLLQPPPKPVPWWRRILPANNKSKWHF